MEEVNKRILSNPVSSNVCRLIAELAYTIAMADNELQEAERKVFKTIVTNELGPLADVVFGRFEILEEILNPDIDKMYNSTMFTIKHHKHEITPEVRTFMFHLVEKMALAWGGKTQGEKFVIDKLRQDLSRILE